MSFYIEKIIVTGSGKTDSIIELSNGVNIIYGPSNTGKTYIDMIRLLSNCSNTATYEYTDEDVKKIFSALESELKTCKSKYQDNSNKESKFTLR